MKIVDSHIHFDKYKEQDQVRIIKDFESDDIAGLVSVSMNLSSCMENLRLASKYPKIYPAFGFHPEQPLPEETEVADLLNWIEGQHDKMVAVGEVGLPYYMRSKQKGGYFPNEAYIEILDQFILLAKRMKKPVILHAVYEDAPVVCDLLEKHNVTAAHFHWFKGDGKTIERMIENGYFVSFTPDILYEEETREVVRMYPLHLTMAETDGPWPFEGIFREKMTHPSMVHEVLKEISAIKKIEIDEVYTAIFNQVKQFYLI